MTRKRFVKLLMSRGYSRNEANRMALAVVSRDGSYGCEYFSILCNMNGTTIAEFLGDIGDAAVLMGQTADNLVRTFCEILPTIIEAITAAVPQVIAAIERIKQATEAATE